MPINDKVDITKLKEITVFSYVKAVLEAND